MISAFSAADRLPDRPPLSIRMASYLDAYGTERSFARFWKTDGDGFLSVVDSAATVLAGDGDDDEIVSFLSFSGAASVLSDRLLFPGRQRALGVYRKSGVKPALPMPDPDYERAYAILNGSFSLPPWPVWYVDACHRVRHGASVLVQHPHGALFAARRADQFLLTGVAVDPDHRREGIASHLLNLTFAAGARSVYAITEDEEAERFYVGSGFTFVTEVYYYEEG